MTEPRWYCVDEKGNDNFATSIYEAGDKGLLVARCNQNGSYPWQGQAIIRGLEANKALFYVKIVRAVLTHRVVQWYIKNASAAQPNEAEIAAIARDINA